jgi:O-antigen/teichoic acid export membrane protein
VLGPHLKDKGSALPHRALRRILAGELIWSITGNLAVQTVNLAAFLVLARLLGPAPYGILGLAAVALAFSWTVLVEGCAEFLVRAPSISPGHANAAFWIQLGLSLVLGAAMAAGLHHLALATGEAELVRVVPWLSVIPVLYALAGTHRALLQRALRFRLLAGCSLASAALGSAVGVTAALRGNGALSLALMMLCQCGSLAGLLWCLAGWRPGFSFRRTELGQVLSFGGHLLTASLAGLAELQGNRLLIGLSAGPVGLGLFTMA